GGTFSGSGLGRRGLSLSRGPSQVGDVAVYRFRLADVFGAVDRLQLLARVKRLADSVSFLPEHRLFVGDDVLPAVVELDDGVWRVSLEQRRQSEGEEMDLRDHLLRRGFYRSPLDRVAAPDPRRDAAVLPARALGQCVYHDRRRTAFTTVRRNLLHDHRTAHVPRRYGRDLPDGRSAAREQTQTRRRRDQRPLLALRRSRLDVCVPVDLHHVG